MTKQQTTEDIDGQLSQALMEKAKELLNFAEHGVNIMFAGRDKKFKQIMWLAISDCAKQYAEKCHD